MRDLPRGGGGGNGGWVIQLPEHFVDSLRVLFDILDTSRCGLVSFDQIAKKWGDFPSPTNHLPSHFLESLRRVTPVGGMLTFERFLAGVRLSLQERRQGTNSCSGSRLHRVRSEGKLEEDNYFGSTKERSLGSQSRGSVLPAMGLNGYSRPNHLSGALSHRSQPVINADCLQDSNPSFESAKRAINENLSLNGRVSSRKAQAANYSIVMRPKKMKNVRAPLPPQHNSPRQEAAIPLPNRSFRPLSTNSINSVCSSGMTEVPWRNSRMSNIINSQSVNNTNNNSSSPSPPSNSTVTSYAEELQPQVAKHEQLLNEEYRIVQKGVDTTKNLLAWYTSRMESLGKRRNMLDKGMVALDSSVHEQKLNFYRAQITELNRRMKGLIASSERGFPSHQNMLRMPMAPLPTANAGGSLGSSASSTSTNPSSSPHSSPEPQHTLHFFKQQHQKLIEELDAKSRLIEQLQREKRLHQVQQSQQMLSGIDKSLLINNNNYSHTRPISVAAYVRPQQLEQSKCFQPISTANNNNCSKALKIHDTLL